MVRTQVIEQTQNGNSENLKSAGARHSIYYTRNGTEASLLIDRKEVKLEIFTTQTFIPTQDPGSNEVQIGGVNTTDPRFAIYKGYSGCLSSKHYYLSTTIF